MRFRLTIKVEKTALGNKLPINYPYLLSSWIYHVVAKGDAAYAAWLHDNAFRDGSKVFKFFVFSNLNIPKLKLEGDRLCILSDTVSFHISFLPEKSTEEFIKGLFQDQRFTLGDRQSKVQFEVQQVELIPTPEFMTEHVFKTISPVVVAVNELNGRTNYLSPEQKNYGLCLMKNLKEKYKAYAQAYIDFIPYNQEFMGSEEFVFEPLTAPKSRLVTIKAGEPSETKIRGFLYKFRLKSDKELLRIAYETGLGEKGSMGFGMIEISNNNV